MIAEKALCIKPFSDWVRNKVMIVTAALTSHVIVKHHASNAALKWIIDRPSVSCYIGTCTTIEHINTRSSCYVWKG